MGQATPVILNVSAPEYKKLIIETSDGHRYHSDLSSLSKIYCFPKDLKQWMNVYIDQDGIALGWSCRFEVHVDQVIGLAFKTEKLSHSSQLQP